MRNCGYAFGLYCSYLLRGHRLLSHLAPGFSARISLGFTQGKQETRLTPYGFRADSTVGPRDSKSQSGVPTRNPVHPSTVRHVCTRKAICVFYIGSPSLTCLFLEWAKRDSRRTKCPYAFLLRLSLCVCFMYRLFFYVQFRINASNSAQFCHVCWELY